MGVRVGRDRINFLGRDQGSAARVRLPRKGSPGARLMRLLADSPGTRECLSLLKIPDPQTVQPGDRPRPNKTEG